jgi:hypothetical protein
MVVKLSFAYYNQGNHEMSNCLHVDTLELSAQTSNDLKKYRHLN